MSRRRARRIPVPRRRARREVVLAVGLSVAVVAGTALLVWLLRPGSAATPGTGGLAHRQPRVTWLVVLSVAAALSATAWILRPRSRLRARRRIAVPAALVVVAAGTVGAGFAWPSGLLRHPIAPPDLSDIDLSELTTPDLGTAPIETPTTAPLETATTSSAPEETATTGPGGTGTTVPLTAPESTAPPSTAGP